MRGTIRTLALGAVLVAGTATAGMAQGINNTGYSPAYYNDGAYGTYYGNTNPSGRYYGPGYGAYYDNPGYNTNYGYGDRGYGSYYGNNGYYGNPGYPTNPVEGAANVVGGALNAAGNIAGSAVNAAGNVVGAAVPPYGNRNDYYGNNYGYGSSTGQGGATITATTPDTVTAGGLAGAMPTTVGTTTVGGVITTRAGDPPDQACLRRRDRPDGVDPVRSRDKSREPAGSGAPGTAPPGSTGGHPGEQGASDQRARLALVSASEQYRSRRCCRERRRLPPVRFNLL